MNRVFNLPSDTVRAVTLNSRLVLTGDFDQEGTLYNTEKSLLNKGILETVFLTVGKSLH